MMCFAADIREQQTEKLEVEGLLTVERAFTIEEWGVLAHTGKVSRTIFFLCQQP
jgi:hypothetical protein